MAYDTARAGEALPRRALAAAHVVVDPLADHAPWSEAAIDFEASLRFREYLWSLGLGVAESMDAAQRGMGLSWPDARKLANVTLNAARGRQEAMVYVGVGTDHIDPGAADLDTVIRAYIEQINAIQRLDGRLILMASRALAACARSPADFARVYARILAACDRPVILHWLGPMFDPALGGYWGADQLPLAMCHCLDVLAANAGRIEGIKISLLDKNLEIAMRRQLPETIRMYTGDDYNYPELIAGDDTRHSEALLGIFDPLAPLASAALKALATRGVDAFRSILNPTLALSRAIFAPPTRHYKTGVVFLAYLAGHQSHFTMLGGQQSARSLPHLVRLFRLAAALGLFADPDRATTRMKRLLALHGIEN